MKRFITVITCLFIYIAVHAQTDTIPPSPSDSILIADKGDTVRIGRIMIIKHNKHKRNDVQVVVGRKEKHKPSNVSTNWWIFDLGFANYVDNTNYANTATYLVNRPGYPGFSKDDLKLKAGKSVDVNIWIFMQRLNLIKHHLNLKYGLGLELNNYRYNSNISYREAGDVPYSNPPAITNSPYIFRDSISFTKNKLAADYLTVPLMLNFTTNPRHPGKSFLISAGISAGYLYSSRNKQISAERGKQKYKDDFDLEQFKISYVGEIGLGPIRLYGSYSPTSIYQKGLDIMPYTFGIRFSNW